MTTASLTPAADAATPIRFCVFSLAGRHFAIAAQDIAEVARVPPLAPVPLAPASVRGCVNLRGQVHIVVDPRPLLGFPATELDAASRLLVPRAAIADRVGLLVDTVGDVITATAKESLSPAGLAADSSPASRFVAAVVQSEELIWILDARALLAAVQRDVTAGAEQ